MIEIYKINTGMKPLSGREKAERARADLCTGVGCVSAFLDTARNNLQAADLPEAERAEALRQLDGACGNVARLQGIARAILPKFPQQERENIALRSAAWGIVDAVDRANEAASEGTLPKCARESMRDGLAALHIGRRLVQRAMAEAAAESAEEGAAE